MRGFGAWLAARIIARALRREPDFVVGGKEKPYLKRWWLLPRNKVFNVYLHQFLRSDEDRALHDHPWPSLSWSMQGELVEYTPNSTYVEGVDPSYREFNARVIEAGSWTFRGLKMRHRLVVRPELSGKIFTLFITGPVVRTWGFWCPKGFVRWFDFVDPKNPGMPGAGCGDSH